MCVGCIMHIFVALLATFVAASWGLNAAVTKYGALNIPPLTLLVFRYFLTALIFLPFAKIKKSETGPLLKIAFLEGVVTNGAIYTAFKYLSPTASTLLLQTGAPLAVMLACIFGRERISKKETAGIILSLAGVVVIAGLPDISLLGCALILLSRLSWASTQLLYKKLPSITAASFIAYMSLFALPFLIPAALISDYAAYGGVTDIKWGRLAVNMVYQVGVLSLSMIIWQRLIAAYGVSRISPFSILQIVFGILGGIALFGDVITLKMALGIAMVTSGLILTVYSRRSVVPKVAEMEI